MAEQKRKPLQAVPPNLLKVIPPKTQLYLKKGLLMNERFLRD